jgi:hypothetical protein
VKKQINRLGALVFCLALAHTTSAGIIHGPNADPPPDGPQMVLDATPQTEELDAADSFALYTFELLRTAFAAIV